MLTIENYSKIKFINYKLNTDNTYNISFLAEDEDGLEIYMEYLKVKIKWYYPKNQKDFILPIPEGFKILKDDGINGEMYYYIM